MIVRLPELFNIEITNEELEALKSARKVLKDIEKEMTKNDCEIIGNLDYGAEVHLESITDGIDIISEIVDNDIDTMY